MPVEYYININLFGDIEANSFITKGGTSSQFVKGDGSLDGTNYFENNLTTITDANDPLGDGIYRTTSSTLLNAPFGYSALIVKHDLAQRIDLLFGDTQPGNRLAVRRWDNGIARPWTEFASQDWATGNFVDLTTNQTINGNKTFNDDIILGNGSNAQFGTGITETAENRTLQYIKHNNGNNIAVWQAGVRTNPQDAYTATNNFGFGYAALRQNTGINSNGFGYAALRQNTGNYSNGFGYAALRQNTGNYSNGFGYQALRYNNSDAVTSIGHATNNGIILDPATEKQFVSSDINVANNTITINNHGFGSAGRSIRLEYHLISGTNSSLSHGDFYLWDIVDANTLKLNSIHAAISSAGSGVFSLTNLRDITGSIMLGYRNNNTKPNQMVLGHGGLVETVLHGITTGTTTNDILSIDSDNVVTKRTTSQFLTDLNIASTNDLYSDWKLWTNGVQRTSINSGQKLDLVAGNNMSIGYSAGGVVTLDATNTDTQYTAGTGLNLTGTEFSFDTAWGDGRYALDSNVLHKTGDETKTGILIQEDESVLKNTFTQQIRNAASFYSSSLGKTIVINTPPLNGLSVFIDMEISILDNTTRDLIDVRIEGYWSGSGFVNSRGIAHYSTSKAGINLDFSLGRDANNAPSFIIERITGAFDYTVVNIKNITTSYTNGQNPNLRSGWSIKKETDLSGYTRFSIPKSKAANTDWVNSQGFLKQVNWGDIEGTLSNQTDLKAALESKGVQLTADQPNAMVYLKDSNGNVISSLNVGFLNNEGTTIFFNSATDEIELKNDAGNVLSSFPASALMTGVGYGLNLTGSTLDLVDSANNVIDSVTLTIANIQGLQAELNNKFDADYSNAADADIANNTQNFVNVSSTTANGFGGFGSIISSMGSTGYIQFGMKRNDGLYERVQKGSWDRLATRPWVQSQNYLTSETDPTVPSHVKAITTGDINDWNGKAELSDINNGTLTLTTGTGLTGSDTFSANQAANTTFTVGLSAATQASLALADSALQSVDWGDIGGTLSNQTDLQNALNAKEDAFSKNTAFNKNFGTASGTVAEGNHNHDNNYLSIDANNYSPAINNSIITDANTVGNVFNYMNAATANTPSESNGYYVLSGGSITSSPNFKAQLLLGTNQDAMYYRSTINGTYGSYYHMASREWVANQNFATTAQLPTVNNNTITINPQGILTGGGSFNLNQGTNETLNITAPSFGTAAGTVAEGNHTHSASDITSGTLSYARLPISAAQVSNWGDAYTHSEITSGNPHGVSYSNILGTQPIPTLLQTINAGNVLNATTTDIDLNGGSLNFIDTESIFLFHDNSLEFFMDKGTFRLSTNRDAPNNPFVSIQTNLLTDDRDIQFPDASGTLALTSDIPSVPGTNLTGSLTGTTLNVNSSTGTDANISLTGIDLQWVLNNGSSANINSDLSLFVDDFIMLSDRAYISNTSGVIVDLASAGLSIRDGNATTGTNGQVLTSDGTYATWQDLPAPVDTTRIARVTLTANQVKALNSNSPEIIPAPGAGKYIIVKGVTLKLNYNSIPFNIGGDHTGLVYQDVSSHTDIFPVQPDTTFVNFINSSFNAVKYWSITETNFYAQENLPITLNTFSASHEATQGNSTLDVIIYYDIV